VCQFFGKPAGIWLHVCAACSGVSSVSSLYTSGTLHPVY